MCVDLLIVFIVLYRCGDEYGRRENGRIQKKKKVRENITKIQGLNVGIRIFMFATDYLYAIVRRSRFGKGMCLVYSWDILCSNTVAL